MPLQAVKKQRNKSTNEPSDMNQKKENNAFNININENVDKNKSVTTGSKNGQSQVKVMVLILVFFSHFNTYVLFYV